MRTIVFCNGKGGVGKTTVTLMLACLFKAQGKSVSVDDRDGQGSAKQFAKELGLSVGTDGDMVLIDTAPRLDHGPSLDAVEKADLVIIVTSPSPPDLTTTVRCAEVVKSRRGKKATRILFNSVVPNTRLAKEVSEISLPYPTLKTTLKRRQGFQLACFLGLKALPAAAKAELDELAREIMGLIK